jgi:hypothetical protein
MDRRRATRLDVERTCRVAATALPTGGITGVTANVSRSGMLVKFPDKNSAGPLPKVGEPARIVLDLPENANYAPRALECVASVVRAADSGEDSPTLAFAIHKMKIRPRKKQSGPGTPSDGGLVQ